MDLLSTACTAERREKSHFTASGRQQTVCWWRAWEGDSEGLHDTDGMFHTWMMMHEEAFRRLTFGTVWFISLGLYITGVYLIKEDDTSFRAKESKVQPRTHDALMVKLTSRNILYS